MSQTWNPTLLVLEEAASTNDYLLKQDALLCRSGQVVQALRQTAGRGRLGRSWQAGGQGNLTFSLSLDPRPYPIPLYSFTLLAGLALQRALTSLGLRQSQLKWPNDLLAQGKKMAGILCESAQSSQGPRLVIGVGVNLLGPQTQFSADLAETATTLEAEIGQMVPAAQVLQGFLDSLAQVLEALGHTGLAPLLHAWEQESSSLGKSIYCHSPQGWNQGKILGLAPDGRLRVQGDDGQVWELLSGDTSFRPPAPEPEVTPRPAIPGA